MFSPPHLAWREKRGDLFADQAAQAFAHCVSHDLKMGAGIAVQFKKRYGGLAQLLKQRQTYDGVGTCLTLHTPKRTVFYLVTKARYFDKPTYSALQKALVALRDQCHQRHITSLAMPRIGCGLDKLDWPRVKTMIQTVFRAEPMTITVYALK